MTELMWKGIFIRGKGTFKGETGRGDWPLRIG